MTNLSQSLARIQNVFTESEKIVNQIVKELERKNPHKKIDVRV